jgi:hypothetical protein
MHADWCQKVARPRDPKKRGYVEGSILRVGEAPCTCQRNAMAMGLRRLARALEKAAQSRLEGQ